MLGIDIKPTSIQILEFSNHRDKYCVEQYASVLLPDGWCEAASTEVFDLVVNRLKSVFSHVGFLSQQAIVAVPNAYVINKIIQLSAHLSEQDIEEQVFLAVESHIPYPLNEINLDFKILGVSSQSDALLDVLVIASRAETINLRLELLHRAGISVQIVDVDTYALERSIDVLVGKNGRHKNIAMFDVDSNYLRVYVVHNMKIIFLRDDVLDVTSSCERFAGFSSLVSQIKRALQFFTLNHHVCVDEILLSGEMGFLPTFAAFLERELNIPSQLVNPFKHMSFSSQHVEDNINKNCLKLMVAYGLALRGCRGNQYDEC